jgi:hypothetical protein
MPTINEKRRRDHVKQFGAKPNLGTSPGKQATYNNLVKRYNDAIDKLDALEKLPNPPEKQLDKMYEIVGNLANSINEMEKN